MASSEALAIQREKAQADFDAVYTALIDRAGIEPVTAELTAADQRTNDLYRLGNIVAALEALISKKGK